MKKIAYQWHMIKDNWNLTPEQRSEKAKLIWKNKTKEEHSAIAKKNWEQFTPEEISDLRKETWYNMKEESKLKHSESIKNSWKNDAERKLSAAKTLNEIKSSLSQERKKDIARIAVSGRFKKLDSPYNYPIDQLDSAGSLLKLGPTWNLLG